MVADEFDNGAGERKSVGDRGGENAGLKFGEPADLPGKGVAFGAVAEVGKYGAGLHGGELVLVAEQNDSCVRLERFEECGHQRERNHRTLISDDEVTGQGMFAVEAEAAGFEIGTQQRMDGRGGKFREFPPDFRVIV